MNFTLPFKAFIAFALLCTLNLNANENAVAAQIIDKTVNALFDGKKISAWGETTAHNDIIRHSAIMEAADDPRYAQFILISKKIPENISKGTVLFTTDYELFSKNERIIGAFYWQKGRPNLLFLRNRLEKADLTLGKEFNKYIEDEL